MTEVKKAREVALVPEELRYVPQIKSDIIIQRRNLSLAPIEAADFYQRDGTNTISFSVVGHQELHQLLAPKSAYFTLQLRLRGGPPVEDVGMLFEEIIISSNGRTIERIRNAQYIQHFVQNWMLSRDTKQKRREEGFSKIDDDTYQKFNVIHDGGAAGPDQDGSNWDHGDSVQPLGGFAGAGGWVSSS